MALPTHCLLMFICRTVGVKLLPSWVHSSDYGVFVIIGFFDGEILPSWKVFFIVCFQILHTMGLKDSDLDLTLKLHLGFGNLLGFLGLFVSLPDGRQKYDFS